MGTRIFALDYSAVKSVPGQIRSHYFHTAKKYLEEFVLETRLDSSFSTVYLLWGSDCKETTLKNLRSVIGAQRMSDAKCRPSALVNWVNQHVLEKSDVDICIITGNTINTTQRRRCLELNTYVKYAAVKFILISSTGSLDMSVGASFFSCTKLKIYLNEIQFKVIDTSIPYDYDSITIENFKPRWPALSDYVQAKVMGTGRFIEEEMVTFDVMFSRLKSALSESSIMSHNAVEQFTAAAGELFQSKNKEDLLRDFETMGNARRKLQSQTTRTYVCGVISSLKFVLSRKPVKFEIIQMDYKDERFFEITKQISHFDNPDVVCFDDVEECKYADYVSVEQESAQHLFLLSSKDFITMIWRERSYDDFKSILDCPLGVRFGNSVLTPNSSLWRDKECGFDFVFCSKSGWETVHAPLIFYSGSTKVDAWNDYAMARTLFCGKRVVEDWSIWYLALYHDCKENLEMEPEFLKTMKAYAFRRLEGAKCKLAMSYLPMEPQILVPYPVACFYCTEGSSILYGQDDKLYLHERLRYFFNLSERMLEVMEYFGYSSAVDVEFVKKRAAAFRSMNSLRSFSSLGKKCILLSEVFKTVDEQFITYEVEDKGVLKNLNLFKYGSNEILPFDFDLSPVNINDHVVVGYGYQAISPIKLCPATYRPYYGIGEDGKLQNVEANYTQILSSVTDVRLNEDGGIQDAKAPAKLDRARLVSCCKYYIDLTKRLGRFPTLEELKDYVASVKRLEGNRVFLFPPNIVELIETTWKVYSDVTADVEDFLLKTGDSTQIKRRIKMEQGIHENQDSF